MLCFLSASEAKPSRNAIGGARGTEAEDVSVIFCEKHFFIAGLWLAWWQAEGWYPNSVASQVFTVTDPDKSMVDSPQLSNRNFSLICVASSLGVFHWAYFILFRGNHFGTKPAVWTWCDAMASCLRLMWKRMNGDLPTNKEAKYF